ncbi:MAG: hypothetical protein A3B74_03030 [Candidatus Kerfeldbacteria bacterium RIFCSPHIGHO2_02_FULL_42_14]|uniref:PLAT domain-containing protein n=1 Tax=Candidatus Kerfeldbacteria bacterium RIFCSPHIGHO2_02_FULL_42_14 TaxID=1798540 RepID=A0A1G2ART5_9BACT|nr:MAG: hypothetical protein A3B74_03030 [Candidatus Kerfeldbacteria bacterium RIFCSPHIGHO2_02_FULL_42_14]OGY80512.1 MAG: hypothetical protein A3E60_03890 [Candidatus Kerfeldbacteria bacterium RIFCSPHIGHO2_12_FULL_42_13]OGY84117.1 MAG: hypothetical protein A3I91_01340 [Candidatus Kerfeldbacteria bacterium RIFCSPLOWO2_02_FULL_42_19]OGY87247.1 MAG: hypothetical protein A3G01_02810 [Candidatus Kerfeldbacteria bacterium RIFCSPLOWO2_12_FULL_43_9]
MPTKKITTDEKTTSQESDEQKINTQENKQKIRWWKTIIMSVVVFLIFTGLTFLSLKIFSDEGEFSFLEKWELFQKTSEAQQIQIDDEVSNINVNKEELEEEARELENDSTEKNTNTNAGTDTTLNTNTNQNINSAKKQKTSNKTFTSQVIPISFKYPANWSLWEGSSPLSNFVQMGDYVPQDSDAFADRVPGHKLELTMQTKPLELTLTAWIAQMDELVAITPNLTDTEVNGFPAKIDTQEYAISVAQSVYIPLGDETDRVIIISLYGPETNPAETTLLIESFLETIKIGKVQ